VKATWLARADRPQLVEHVFAMNAEDDEAIAQTEGAPRVIGEPAPGRVTSVRNWNAAAAASTGDVLFVVADDLFPPPGWDTSLASLLSQLDPRSDAFAVKVTDDPSAGDTLMRHPVVSRAFYERHGLFDPRFDGVCCDDDITRRAFWRSVILDGRAIVLDHRHPTLVTGAVGSESHQRINAPAEYVNGHAVLDSLWTRRQRTVRTRLTPAWLARWGSRGLALGGWVLRLAAELEWVARRARSASRRVTSPGEYRTRG
jgi:hypothetical protein